MIQDRLRTSSIAVTHQRLSDLLGVRRSGVTDAVHLLEGSGVIHARRGMIDVLDRRRLQEVAAGCYGKPESAYEKLILSHQVHNHEVLDQDRA